LRAFEVVQYQPSELNSSKTKETVVDFRRKKPHLQHVSIKGVEVEVVRTYKNNLMTSLTGQ